MKKILTFIPLGIGISAAILYIFNIVSYRIVNNSVTMLQIMTSLKTYLYISILGFIVYFLVKVIIYINGRTYDEKTDTIIRLDNSDKMVVSESKKKEKLIKVSEEKKYPQEKVIEKEVIKEVVLTGNKYCSNCGEKIFDTDAYCRRCGVYQKNKKSGVKPIVRDIINVLEIVILILILYFILNMLFEFKEKQDPNFTSPFKVAITK